MKPLLPVKNILLTALCAVLTLPSAQAKTMYKWTDEHGRVFFSDQVPPSEVNKKREELDKNAQVIDVKEGAKSKAELEMEKRLLLLRKQQEQMIAKQKAIDKKLLSSFLDLKAMDAMYDAKIRAFEGQDKDLREEIKKLQDDLGDYQQKAAGYEIKNQKVPADVLKDIAETQKQILQKQQELKDLQVKTVAFKKEFESDRARFAFLTQQASTDTAKSVSKTPQAKEVNQPGLFSCNTTEQCEKAWSLAKEFVKANSTAKITVDTDILFMSEDPVAETDMRLSLSKMKEENDRLQIFLDIRCVDSVAGKKLCGSQKSDEIRRQFSDYINTRIDSSSAPAAK